jgi:GLPGLI family protein
MRHLIFNIIIVLISISSNAQEFSGIIKYEIRHNWIKKINAVEYLSKSEKEKSAYMWGHTDEYTEDAILYFNNNISVYEEVDEENRSGSWSSRSKEYTIYRNIEENTTYDLIREVNKLFVIEDEIQNQNWKILNDIKDIAGHICMDALYKDPIKGNSIIAWFALDMPVSFGPDRFGGLPGMILEVDINQGAMTISAKKIEEKNVDEFLVKPKHKKRIKYFKEDDYKKLISDQIEQAKKTERPYFWRIRY